MIKNQTKKMLICANFANKTGFGKILGLIGSGTSEAVIFTTRFGIHTFLVKNAIDVLILDKNKKVASIKENLKPNRIFFWNPVFNIVIELPIGSVKKSGTQIGDVLEF